MSALLRSASGDLWRRATSCTSIDTTRASPTSRRVGRAKIGYFSIALSSARWAWRINSGVKS